jgi:hypothetical protein
MKNGCKNVYSKIVQPNQYNNLTAAARANPQNLLTIREDTFGQSG